MIHSSMKIFRVCVSIFAPQSSNSIEIFFHCNTMPMLNSIWCPLSPNFLLISHIHEHPIYTPLTSCFHMVVKFSKPPSGYTDIIMKAGLQYKYEGKKNRAIPIHNSAHKHRVTYLLNGTKKNILYHLHCTTYSPDVIS